MDSAMNKLALIFCLLASLARADSEGNSDAGLIGQWITPGYVNSGFALDSSGFNNKGTVTSGTLVSYGGVTCYGFTSGYIKTTNTNVARSVQTISTWLYPTALQSSFGAVLVWMNFGSQVNGISLDYYNAGFSGSLAWHSYTNSTTPLTPIPRYPLAYNSTAGISNWYHCAVVLNGATITSYFQGVAYGTVAQSQTPTSSGLGLEIGGDSGNSLFRFVGKMGSTKIFNRALTAAEIQQIYSQGPGQ